MTGRPSSYTQEIADEICGQTMKKVEIYGLCCPDTNAVKYIGKSVNSQKRYKQHMSCKKYPNNPLYLWIDELRQKGKKPNLSIISIVDEKNWQLEEIKQISLHNNLLNLSKGGNQPHSEKNTRAMNGKKNAYKVHSDEKRKRIWSLKQKIGYAIKDGFMSEKTKQKLRDGALRHPKLLGQYANI